MDMEFEAVLKQVAEDLKVKNLELVGYSVQCLGGNLTGYVKNFPGNFQVSITDLDDNDEGCSHKYWKTPYALIGITNTKDENDLGVFTYDNAERTLIV
jgi:hypothetical protein